MPNKFDKEMHDLREAAPPGNLGAVERCTDGDFMSDTDLVHLAAELKSSKKAMQADVGCEPTEEAQVSVSVKGQIVGVWKSNRSGLALYRPGAEFPDCVASSVDEAAALTARLVAAVGQA